MGATPKNKPKTPQIEGGMKGHLPIANARRAANRRDTLLVKNGEWHLKKNAGEIILKTPQKKSRNGKPKAPGPRHNFLGLRGIWKGRMTTDQVLELTRGE